MRSIARRLRRSGIQLIFCAAIPLVSSCRKAEITTYRAPKETVQPSAPAMASLPEAMLPAGPKPKVTWQAPVGWTTEEAGQMRVAAFSLKDDVGHTAEVTIIPLPESGESDLSNVNRWRKQVGLVAAAENELPKLGSAITMDGAPAGQFEINGAQKSILVVMQHRDQMLWFVKMMGDTPLVSAQKAAFEQFVASLKIGGEVGSAEVEATPAPESAPAPTSNLPAPKEWQQVAPGPMQDAKYTTEGGAEVSVSIFPGQVGGVLANVNRWRGQLGLAAIAESDLAGMTKPLAGLPGAVLVDLAATDGTKRMLAAMVPREAQTAFYKITGTPAAVEAEQARFTQFVEAAK
ncbi:MAG: hypothetical protein QM796_04750 [Chthoniobacteraceae bacterium]